jgi:hypothetical protein
MLAVVSFFGGESCTTKKRPTKRAADWWDSSRLTSIFLASGFPCSQAESTPAHQRLTQTVGRFLAKLAFINNKKESFRDKFGIATGDVYALLTL